MFYGWDAYNAHKKVCPPPDPEPPPPPPPDPPPPGRVYTCGYCGGTFTDRDVLNEHMDTHDRAAYTHRCIRSHPPGVPWLFKGLEALRLHQRDYHGMDVDPPHKCFYCPLRFWSEPERDAHADLCYRPHYWLCGLCCEGFATKEELMAHIAAQHPDRVGTTYRCPYCGIHFDTKQELEAHKTKHTGKPPPDWTPPEVPPGEEPPPIPPPPITPAPPPYTPVPPDYPDDVPFTETRWFPIVMIAVAVVAGIIAVAAVARS